jgi:hypothetical protein
MEYYSKYKDTNRFRKAVIISQSQFYKIHITV